MKLSLRIILILALINLFIWGFFLWPQTPALVVTFFDVGEGDSAFIKFPYGGNMLIDGGPGGRYNSGEKVILPYLRQKGIRKIERRFKNLFSMDDRGSNLVTQLKVIGQGWLISRLK